MRPLLLRRESGKWQHAGGYVYGSTWFFCVNATICMFLFSKGHEKKSIQKKIHWYLYNLTDSIRHYVWLVRSIWAEQVGCTLTLATDFVSALNKKASQVCNSF